MQAFLFVPHLSFLFVENTTIFKSGVMHPPQFNMDIQVHLPPALAALHNFIQKHNPEDLADYESIEDPQPGTCTEGPAAEGSLAEGIPRLAERQLANQIQTAITWDMWLQYQDKLLPCGLI